MPVIERLSEPSALLAVARLLRDCGLPVDDLQHPDNRFFGIYQQNELIACGGLQAVKAFALLRSLAVSGDARRQGLGRQLLDYLLQQARLHEFTAVYLLTENNPGYFEASGFGVIDRSQAPAPVAATAQFSALCPASAVCLMRVLHSEDSGQNP